VKNAKEDAKSDIKSNSKKDVIQYINEPEPVLKTESEQLQLNDVLKKTING
jgi:hypothetical protein